MAGILKTFDLNLVGPLLQGIANATLQVVPHFDPSASQKRPASEVMNLISLQAPCILPCTGTATGTYVNGTKIPPHKLPAAPGSTALQPTWMFSSDFANLNSATVTVVPTGLNLGLLDKRDGLLGEKFHLDFSLSGSVSFTVSV